MKCVERGHVFEGFGLGDVSGISNGVESLEELEMRKVVSSPESVVVSDSDVEVGNLLGDGLDLVHSLINIISGLHERIVLVLEFLNNTRSSDLRSPAFPIRGRIIRSLSVEELKESAKLSSVVSTIGSLGSASERIHPSFSEVRV